MKTFKLILITSLVVLHFACSPKINNQTIGKSTVIRVLSYNIHHCNPPSKEGLIDVNAVAKAIQLQNPDIVALQEVDVNTKRSGNINEAELLAKKLKMHFYFGKAIDHDGGDYGVAILSKYPLSNQVTFKLPKNDDPKAEQRVLALATITLINSQKIRFASTHLDAQKNDVNRLMQAAEINRLTANEKLPLIVAGDLNADPTSEVIKVFDTQFVRSCTECAFTIPVINPRKTIDHIGFKKGDKFKVLSHEVIPERYASDHLPLLTVFQLNP